MPDADEHRCRCTSCLCNPQCALLFLLGSVQQCAPRAISLIRLASIHFLFFQVSLTPRVLAGANTQPRILALPRWTRSLCHVRVPPFPISWYSAVDRINDHEDPLERMLAVLRFTFSKDIRHVVSYLPSFCFSLIELSVRSAGSLASPTTLSLAKISACTGMWRPSRMVPRIARQS